MSDEVKLAPRYSLFLNQQSAEARAAYGVDLNWITKVAESEVFVQLFPVVDRKMLVIATLVEIKPFVPRQEFDVLAGESPEYFVLAILNFVGEMPEETLEQSMLDRLIAFCIVFMAGTHGAKDPKAFIEKAMSHLPPSAERVALVEHFEFEKNDVDWTQYLIDNPSLAVEKTPTMN